jgi:hypothetical protein
MGSPWLLGEYVLEYRYQMSALFISKVFSQEYSESEPLLSVSRQVSPRTLASRCDVFKRPERNECDHRSRDSTTALGPDAEFGDREVQKKLEERLFLKLDARIFIFIIIYILNYVSFTRQIGFRLVFRNSLHTD